MVREPITPAACSGLPGERRHQNIGDAADETFDNIPAYQSGMPCPAGVPTTTARQPQKTSVPNVVGDTQATATTALGAAGLTLGTVSQAPSATVALGEVISETPAAAASVAPGSSVALTVSSGPPPVNVPQLVNDTVAQATTALQNLGLTLGAQTSANSPTVPSGEIISEMPISGTSVAIGSAVAVVVSTGPALTRTVTLLHSFAGTPTDGAGPSGVIIQGSDGNFYGTTAGGGQVGIGALYQITPTGSEKVLYSFPSAVSGDGPQNLIQGSDGNFYGTTNSGGAANEGTVFRVTPGGSFLLAPLLRRSTRWRGPPGTAAARGRR